MVDLKLPTATPDARNDGIPLLSVPQHVMIENQFMGPLFLLGYGRSGTKLLRSLLSAHPSISICDVETNFLITWAKEWQSYGSLENSSDFRKFYKKVTRYPYFIYRIRQGRLIDETEWHALIRQYTPAGVFEALLRHDCHVPWNSGIVWGDKSPNYTSHLAVLRGLFPSAKFVHIVRDVRDVAWSSKQAWGSDVYRVCQRWADTVMEPRKQAQDAQDCLCEIRYEDLIAEPEITLRTICAYLKLPYDEKMVVLHAAPENLGKAKGLRTILKNNTCEGRRHLSKRVLSRFDQIAGEQLYEFGYIAAVPCRQRRVGKCRMWYLRLMDGARHLLREIKSNGVREGTHFVWRFFRLNRKAGD